MKIKPVNLTILLIIHVYIILLSDLLVEVSSNQVADDNPARHYLTPAKQLYNKLLIDGSYNKLIRPVGNTSDALDVRIRLRLTAIVDIDEKNQVMTTNVWLEQHWYDQRLVWNPSEHAGISKLYLPSVMIWLPDIVLYNSADGNFTIKMMTKATVFNNGLVIWIPPVTYKSLCSINVEYFPFDDQLCTLKIGSWSYDGVSVDINHLDLPADAANDSVVIMDGINLLDYGPSTEWDLLEVPAQKYRKWYPCCSEPYPDIKFNITIRRKTLYHAVNLILPCVAICSVTLLVFFIPVYTGEKITMAITILNSLNIFLLLVAEINPPTSLAVPLIGKFLLFTMVIVTGSIIVSVFVLNVHFRSPSTHEMHPWIKHLFLYVLPRLLFMQRPGDKIYMKMKRENAAAVAKGETPPHRLEVLKDLYTDNKDKEGGAPWYTQNSDNVTSSSGGSSGATLSSNSGADVRGGEFGSWPVGSGINGERPRKRLPPAMMRAVIGVNFIAEHLKEQDENKKVMQDWQFMAMVLDRLFMWIFTSICFVGTFGIIVQAPMLYDYRTPIG